MPEPVAEPTPAIEVPPYAALYKSGDCTGEYLNIEVDPATGMGTIDYPTISGAGFNDNTNSVGIRSFFAVSLYEDSNAGGANEMFMGQGNDFHVECYPLGNLSNQVSYIKIFSMEGNSLQFYLDSLQE